MKEYFAHRKFDKNGNEIRQTVAEHCISVAQLTSTQLKEFSLENTGLLVGYLHDAGKTSKEFQDRLLNNGPKVNHSTAGAVLLNEIIGNNAAKFLRLMQCVAIMCHHRGLVNSDDFFTEIQHSKIPEFDRDYIYNFKSKEELKELSNAAEKEIAELFKNVSKNLFNKENLKINLKSREEISRVNALIIFAIAKLILSALANADHFDAKRFMESSEEEFFLPNKIKEVAMIFGANIQKYRNLDNNDNISEINKVRAAFLNSAIQNAGKNCEKHFKSLQLKTGAGKTITSMAYALNRCVKMDKKRVISVIPFLSITEQNAAEYKKLIGENYVLEHHSNVDLDNIEDEYAKQNHSDDCQCWKHPVIITTSVQFFESLFSANVVRNKKFINCANSVVIIDEAQMMPLKFLRITQLMLCVLSELMNIDFVFCSATTPDFPYISDIEPIIPDSFKYDSIFERCIASNIGEVKREKLLDLISKENRAICIVNTKNKAKSITEDLIDMANKGTLKVKKENIFHLSGNMLSIDKRRVIDEVNRILKSTDEDVILIATQLVEAGVDFSFKVGFREMAGLDSIVQAAGRINRNKEYNSGMLYVFSEEDSKKVLPRDIEYFVDASMKLVKDFNGNLLNEELLKKYFYNLNMLDESRNDEKGLVSSDYLSVSNISFKINMKDISARYNIIESTNTVIVDFEDSRIKKSLKNFGYCDFKTIQERSVNIYESQLKKYIGENIVENIEGYYLVRPGFYSQYFGLQEQIEAREYFL